MTANDILIADLIAANVDPVLVVRVRAVVEQLERRKNADADRQRRVREQRRAGVTLRHATPVTLRHATEPVTEPVRSDRTHRPAPKFPWPADYREQFWNRYPRRVGKKAALTKLDNVRRADEVAFDALLAAVRRIDTKELQYVPHPATWLHQGRYLDAGPVPVDDEPVWRKPPPGMKSALNNGGGR